MDSRSAAHVLTQIASYLELAGENRFKARAYVTAARSILALGTDDLTALLNSGELKKVRGLGPATLSVVRDLVESGESSYLQQLRDGAPEGLIEMSKVPGLSLEKIRKLHDEMGIETIAELEEAARSGRLAKVKGFGPKTAAKIVAGIEFVQNSVALTLYPHAIVQARAILNEVAAHPGVSRAEIGGSLRRRREVARDVDIVAACSTDPVEVAQSFSRAPGVRSARGDGSSVSITYVDGARLDLFCVRESGFAGALFEATGSEAHVQAVTARLPVTPPTYSSEQDLYAAAGLAWIPPELREDMGEIDVAAHETLPLLVELSDIRGVLHCHTTYSDGKASVAEMAEAARARGWSYLGISDHSQAAFYAGGVSREMMLEQHDEIDALNEKLDGFRVLKGVEADILADGRLDYDEKLLDRFDYVIASIHSRFKMDGAAMTERVLHAMDDPHMTVLAHPTGRLLLSREPYVLDVDAVLEKAAATGIAIEVNADPHRLDLDWRYLKRAKELGVTIEIGPDAHGRSSLDWTELGVAMARKGWLEASDILNARDAAGVQEFARARRE